MTSLISSLSWIPRGAAAQHPTKYRVDEDELARVQGLARGQLDAAKLELEMAQALEAEADRDGDEGEGEGWEECVLLLPLCICARAEGPRRTED